MNTLDLSIREMNAAFANGKATPKQAVETTLESLDTAPNAFTQVLAERALAASALSGKRWQNGCPLGPLDGVPTSIKDLLDLKDTPTTGASEIYRNAPPPARNAVVTQHLLDAGCTIIGKTNLSEFAYAGIGMNSHYGNPENVYGSDEPRISGGSSSGAAIAAARGLTPVSIGTDTAGSVRIPSALNGLVGFKPTTDYYSREGVMPLSTSLDSIGLLARSVDDIRIIDATLHKTTHPEQETSRDLSDLVLIAVQGTVLQDLDESVQENYDRTLAMLQEQGATVVPMHLPEVERAFDLIYQYGALTGAEVGHIHRELLASDTRNLMDRRTLRRIEETVEIRASDYVLLLEERKVLTLSLNNKLGRKSLLVQPTIACTAPTIRELDANDDVFFAANKKILRNTMVGNFFNQASVTLPNGTDQRGLTTGIQFATIGGNDAVILDASQRINNSLNPKQERITTGANQ